MSAGLLIGKAIAVGLPAAARCAVPCFRVASFKPGTAAVSDVLVGVSAASPTSAPGLFLYAIKPRLSPGSGIFCRTAFLVAHPLIAEVPVALAQSQPVFFPEQPDLLLMKGY